MNWINLHTKTLAKPEYSHAKPAQQGTWLNLLRYCCVEENGGLILGCRTWTQRDWHISGLERREVLRPSPLWAWEGDNLRVALYPLKHEATAEANRRKAEATNAKRNAKRDAKRDADRDADRDANAMQGNEMEAKVSETPAPAGSTPFPEANIPSLDECLQWGASAGVAPDWIKVKFASTTEDHGWVRNGIVINWQARWKRWFDEDRQTGRWPKKNGVPVGAWPEHWNDYTADQVKGMLYGSAQIKDEATVAQCAVWLKAHGE